MTFCVFVSLVIKGETLEFTNGRITRLHFAKNVFIDLELGLTTENDPCFQNNICFPSIINHDLPLTSSGVFLHFE